jgi:hypothetical protein
MLFGNYWEFDQVAVASVREADAIPDSVFASDAGKPAILANVLDEHGSTIEFIFVEIVPGTEAEEHFLNLNTGQFESGPCAKVNIYMGQTFKFEDMVLKMKDSWPLAWFRLTRIPETSFDPVAAYERAMAIIGG